MPSTIDDNSLRPYQNELRQLGELGGIFIHRKIFSCIIELLNMGVDAETIFNILKTVQKSTENPRSSARFRKSH